MTLILRKINEAIEASRTDKNLLIDEDIHDYTGKLFLSGIMDQNALDKWSEVFDLKPEWLDIDFVDDSHDSIIPSQALAGTLNSITLTFPTSLEARHILTYEGWNIFLHNDQLLSKVKVVHLAFIDDCFETHGFCVKKWDELPIEEINNNNQSQIPPSVKAIIKCYSSDFMPSEKINCWILKSLGNKSCKAYVLWQLFSCRELIKCFSNELYKTDCEMIGLSGKPPRKLIFGDAANCISEFYLIQETGKWVFFEGEEIELKHTFLSNELAREWPENINFCDGIRTKLSPALESARLLYKAHIRTSSKETIKSLGELRKSLGDDTQKIIQHSKDLSSSMWKDVALTISTIIIKYTLDATKAITLHNIYSWVFFAVAVYIIGSQSINLYINHRFIKLLENNREIWRKKLYGFLEENDYIELADKPIKQAYKSYNIIGMISTLVACTSALLLIFLGVSFMTSISDFLYSIYNVYRNSSIMNLKMMADIYSYHHL